jgi:predicted amidohydrolase YtcJ
LGIRTGFGDDWLKIGGIKIFADGGSFAHLAALHEPYTDKPTTRGSFVTPKGLMLEEVTKAHEVGLRCCIHAVGDRAQDAVLEVYEKVLKKIPRDDHRHRIEHAGNLFCTNKRMEKAKKLGVIFAINPDHLIAYGDNYLIHYGTERMKKAFPYKTLLENGNLLATGSDALGCRPWRPLTAISTCLTRTTSQNVKIAQEERITPLDAIKLHTIANAYAGFEEDKKGSIESNKIADLVILSDNPLKISPEKIKDIEVLHTIIEGKIVFSKYK